MKFSVKQGAPYDPRPVPMRCPHCAKESAVIGVGVHDMDVGGGLLCGQRKCPSPGCDGHIFVVHRQGKLVEAYPPSTIDFDPKDIPANIVASFDEALRCHSIGCHMAAALLVRRTLEEICQNKGATGKDLKDRIANLKSKIVVPDELFQAMDELRLLGNDAAHIEAKSYDKVSSEEIEVAIEFAKEFLKALYQYSDLLAKLRSLKKLP